MHSGDAIQERMLYIKAHPCGNPSSVNIECPPCLSAKKIARQHGGRGGTVSGLTSTLAFTPVQGFELTDPSKMANEASDMQRSGTESYFSTMSGFRTIRKLG